MFDLDEAAAAACAASELAELMGWADLSRDLAIAFVKLGEARRRFSNEPAALELVTPAPAAPAVSL